MLISKGYKKVFLMFSKIFNIINKLIYKNQKKIVLYSNLGFRDNIKSVYDYLIDNNYNESYKIVCSINDVKKYKNLQIKNVIFTNNYLGLFHFFTSKYFFYCFGKYPIKPSNKQIVINLWHGTPLKKIGNLEEGQEKIDYNYFTYVLAASKPFEEVMMKAFNCKSNNVILCGHPRNDTLFKKSNIVKKREGQKLIVWLPTFRKSEILGVDNSSFNSPIPIFDKKFRVNNLNEFLKKNDMYLIIKLHPMQSTRGIDETQYSNIEISSNIELEKREIGLYELLESSDALITDYSSVYFDYLLLNRPIGFTIDDLGTYGENRGFIFDKPTEYMPGYKINNEDQFYTFLKSINEGIDIYEKEREKINNFANHYKDGNNCKRILEIVGIEK